MKKGLYIAIISTITTICIIAGIFIHFVDPILSGGEAIAENGTNIINKIVKTAKKADKLSKNNIEVSEDLADFSEITINVDLIDCEIVKGDSFHYKYTGNELIKPEYSVENGILTVKQTTKAKLPNNTKKCDLIITIPDNKVLNKVDIQADICDIDLEDIKSEETKVDLNIGSFEVDDCTLGNFTCTGDTGDIKLDNSDFTNADISCDIGDVKITSSKDLSDYTFEISTDIGNIKINDNKNGTKYNVLGSSEYKLKISNDIGDIKLEY